MEENNDIENLFREGLQNQELPVRPEVWNNISSSLSGASAAAGAGAAAKTSLLKSIVIGASSVAVIAVTGYAIYATSGEEEPAPPAIQTELFEEANAPSEEGLDKTSATKYAMNNFAADEKNDQEESAVTESVPNISGRTKRSAADVFGTPRSQKNFNRAKSNPNKSEEPAHGVADESAKSASTKAQTPLEASPSLSVDMYISNKNPEVFEEVILKSTLPEAENSWLLPNGKIHVGSELTYTMEKSGVQKIELLAVLKDGTELIKTVELSVKAISSLGELPNVLTPNGDGRNDEYTVNVENVKQFSLTVFNAKGKEVFRSLSIENTWKGLDMSGNKLPEGTYRTVVNMVGVDGERHQRMQTVRLAF